jgi:threonine dehydrogenase-like Zn-dependent dehydrogenase
VIVNNCFGLLRKGGRAVLVGLPKEPLHVDNVLNNFIFRAITGTLQTINISNQRNNTKKRLESTKKKETKNFGIIEAFVF